MILLLLCISLTPRDWVTSFAFCWEQGQGNKCLWFLIEGNWVTHERCWLRICCFLCSLIKLSGNFVYLWCHDQPVSSSFVASFLLQGSVIGICYDWVGCCPLGLSHGASNHYDYGLHTGAVFLWFRGCGVYLAITCLTWVGPCFHLVLGGSSTCSALENINVAQWSASSVRLITLL